MNLNSGRSVTESVDVVVVGAGQAGLSVSYYLRSFGIEHVVLERGVVGESWRSQRWDSFTLVTPNWMTRLPGHLLAAGTGADFICRDAVVGMLERFAAGLPVREGVDVLSVAEGDRGYRVTTPGGEVSARAVVIAGGGQRVPVIPPLAARLPAELHQCDAAQLPQPGRLAPGRGPGSGQRPVGCADRRRAGRSRDAMCCWPPAGWRGCRAGTGAAISTSGASSLACTTRLPSRSPTRASSASRTRCCRAPAVATPSRCSSWPATAYGCWAGWWTPTAPSSPSPPDLPENMQLRRRAGSRVPPRRRLLHSPCRDRGGVPPDTDPAELPVPAIPDAPLALDTRAEGITSVVWCTGFGPDTGWVDVPVLRADGSPRTTAASPPPPACTWLVIPGCRPGVRGSCTGSPPTPPGSPSTSPPSQKGTRASEHSTGR